ncbi:polyketide synthase [Ktedonobacter sp. SOSP1-52]|uniref:type I polyketide synthase n=1 Tax=Ktedonobacter sp. SOSP1-52 TaxID=2778366 RepID=UPI001A1A6932|nr:type I polyketide synthase [Ktedonobacter sp. SOSP1-52]GHO72105.1 polyketide synthase [Ktedonobacter sp. SOSP1-52]
MNLPQQNEPIAIIGMGCRFPGAPNPQAFWRLMCDGIDAITEVPPDRYDVDAFYDPRPATPGKVMSRYGGFLDQVDQFDASFFGISPREAAKIDPQHRLLMEVAWEAMEDAGLAPAQMSQEERLYIGTFIGILTGDFWDRQFKNAASLDVYGTTGSARSGAAGRISYTQDLMGTSFAIDAACSSSLIAVDQAVHNLRAGACRIAVAGGVNVILNPDHTIGFSQGKMMAPDGHCKTYDAAADGYVRSEGAGVVILKLLSQAQADGDQIYAIIRGSASNNDGHCDSFMAPSTQGQQAGLKKALENAGVDPLTIGFVEAHGPGTKAGDPVEIETLGEVLCKDRSAEHALLVGSVKTNIGHTEGAAGVTGLIKAALSLKHGMIPGNLHFHTPSPAIPWERYALTIPTDLTPWPRSAGTPRRAAVCSYGIAGTNSYTILEEAPYAVTTAAEPDEESSTTYLLPLSAQTDKALQELAQRYIAHLEQEEYQAQTLRDICYTASLGRQPREERLAVTSSSKSELHKKLSAFGQGETSVELLCGRAIATKKHKIAWIFPGQGSQWLGMGRDLLAQEPAFRAAIEACDRVMGNYVDWSLLDLLQINEDPARLDEIDVIQPTLFAIEVALAALWRSWGVEPDAVVGHSMGETAAAYIAGALSLEDAAWIICSRSKLALRQRGKGAMAAVELSLEQATALVKDNKYEERVAVAVSNSPNSTVLSGDAEAMKEILTVLEEKGIFGRLVRVDFASHSPQMDLLRDDLLSLMQRVQPHPASVPMLSTVDATYIEGRELTAQYWVENLRKPVLFLNATQELLEEGFDIFMEMSPHPILVGAIRQTIEQSDKPAMALASLRRDEGRNALLTTLGTLYLYGYDVEWSRLYPDGGQRVSLPTYPWQRQRHWNDGVNHSQSRAISTWKSDGTLAHPILHIGTPLALQKQTYLWTTEIDAELFPYLEEHRVHDMPVLAGAAYIELALAAATEIFGARHFCIEDLQLKKVLFFPKDTRHTLQVTLTPHEAEEGSWVLQFYSTQAEQGKQAVSWTHHATAMVRRVEEFLISEAHPPLLPEQAPDQWTMTMEAPAFYEGIRARGIQHGPRFQGVTHIWRRPGEVMAKITVPQEVTDERSGYQVHPALMDAILQGIIPFLPETNEDSYVPVMVKQVRLYQQPESTGSLWSHATLRSDNSDNMSTIEGNIILLDGEGHVLLEVLGFRLQSLEDNTQGLMRQRLNQLLYTIQWEQQALSKQQEHVERKRWLIFGEHEGPAQQLVKYLQESGAQYIIATPGNAYKQIQQGQAQQYELNPVSPEEFHQLFSELSQGGHTIDGIVYLWSQLTRPVNEASTVHALSEDQQLASIGMLHLLQALTAAKQESTPRLYLATSGVHAIEEHEETTALSQAPLWGLGRVIVYEHQDLHATLIDLDPTPSEESIEALGKEILANDEADEVALRGQRRYVARLAHHTLPNEQEPSESLFRQDGTYVITGGLGGVGLRTAQWMIEQGARTLVLMGRRGPSEEAQATLHMMRETGATVHLMLADVSQEEQLALALDEIRRRMPPLRGIFHSAVVLDDSTLLQLDRERFQGVMPPKVDGAWNLHRLTLNDPLDFFVLFSSAASLIGSPGQGNYAAANAFMDMLAFYRRQQGLPALCINWGRWGEVGQAMKGDRGERLDVRGFASMKPKEGLTVLGELLRQSPPQVGVMSFHLPKWSQFYPNLTSSSLFAGLVEETRAQEQEGAAEPRLTGDMLVMLDEEARHQALSQYLNGHIARVLGHASLNLDAYQPLNRLGIDSLMSVELKNRIRADLGVTIAVTSFLKGVTFEQLIGEILEGLLVHSGEQA